MYAKTQLNQTFGRSLINKFKIQNLKIIIKISFSWLSPNLVFVEFSRIKHVEKTFLLFHEFFLLKKHISPPKIKRTIQKHQWNFNLYVCNNFSWILNNILPENFFNAANNLKNLYLYI